MTTQMFLATFLATTTAMPPPATYVTDIESQFEACQDLHPQLEDLHEKLRSLRSKRNDISIMSKLPSDILSDIFILCLPPIEREFLADYEPPCSEFRTPRIPLRLSAVCGSWRRFVSSIPRLWSTLSIDIYQANLQHVNHRLQLSGSAPLRVQVSASDQANPSPNQSRPSHSFDVVTLVKQNLHRMSFLCLNIPCLFIKAFFSRDFGLPNSLPILEELHFHCSVNGRRRKCMQPHDFILSTDPPCPKKVHATILSIENIRVNWNNVRHLCLEASTAGSSSIVQAAVSLLSECKRLHVVDLIYYPDPISSQTGMSVIQNSIRNLRLFHTSPNVLSRVTMPCLESLTLWQSNCYPLDPLVSFLQRSACPLKTMVWKPFGSKLLPPEPAFIDVFQCTPKLEQLSLDLTDILDEDSERHVIPFLKHLACASHDAASAVPLHNRSHLPLLQKFVYTGPTIHASLSLLLDVAEARSRPFSASEGGQVTRPLEELVVYRFLDEEEFEPPTGTDLERILRLNAANQKVSVLGHDVSCEMVNNDFSAYYHD